VGFLRDAENKLRYKLTAEGEQYYLQKILPAVNRKRANAKKPSKKRRAGRQQQSAHQLQSDKSIIQALQRQNEELQELLKNTPTVRQTREADLFDEIQDDDDNQVVPQSDVHSFGADDMQQEFNEHFSNQNEMQDDAQVPVTSQDLAASFVSNHKEADLTRPFLTSDNTVHDPVIDDAMNEKEAQLAVLSLSQVSN